MADYTSTYASPDPSFLTFEEHVFIGLSEDALPSESPKDATGPSPAMSFGIFAGYDILAPGTELAKYALLDNSVPAVANAPAIYFLSVAPYLDDVLQPGVALSTEATLGGLDSGIVPDELAPEVLNVSPPFGTQLTKTTPISFDIVDETGLAVAVLVVSFADGTVELVHDGDTFRGRYVGGQNTRTTIEGGYRYTILRNGGWVDSSGRAARPRIEWIIRDTGGNAGVIGATPP